MSGQSTGDHVASYFRITYKQKMGSQLGVVQDSAIVAQKRQA